VGVAWPARRESVGAVAKAEGAFSALRRLPASGLPLPRGSGGAGAAGSLTLGGHGSLGRRSAGSLSGGRSEPALRHRQVWPECGVGNGSGFPDVSNKLFSASAAARWARGRAWQTGAEGAVPPAPSAARPPRGPTPRPRSPRCDAGCRLFPCGKRTRAFSVLAWVTGCCCAPCQPRATGSVSRRPPRPREGCRAALRVSAGGQSRRSLRVWPPWFSSCGASCACHPQPQVSARSGARLSEPHCQLRLWFFADYSLEQEESSYKGVLTAAEGEIRYQGCSSYWNTVGLWDGQNVEISASPTYINNFALFA